MKNILVVDDEREFTLDLVEGLGAHLPGMAVSAAFDGQEAMERLKAETVDLVLTDIKMPIMDGLTLLTHMKRQYPFVTRMAMSAYATPDIEERLKGLGTLRVFKKPLDLSEVTMAINTHFSSSNPEGSLDGVSVVHFLQLMESEQRSYLIEIRGKGGGKGYVYFSGGDLYDGLCGNLIGEEAVLELLSWGQVSVRFKHIEGEKIKQRIRTKLINLVLRLGMTDVEPPVQEEPSSPNSAMDSNKSAEEDDGRIRDGPTDNQILLEEPPPEPGKREDLYEASNGLQVENSGGSGENTDFEQGWQQEIQSDQNEEKDKHFKEEESNMPKSKIDELLGKFRQEIPEFVSTDIVEIATGLSIGGGSIIPDFDSTTASAAYSEVVKSNDRGLEALGGAEAVGITEEILISTDKVHILISILGKTGYYHGLAITRKGNLGFARVVMKKYSRFFVDVIRETTGVI